MNLILILLIGIAIGFSLGIYVSRYYMFDRYHPRLNDWKQEIAQTISSKIREQLDDQKNILTEFAQNIYRELQSSSNKIEASQTESQSIQKIAHEKSKTPSPEISGKNTFFNETSRLESFLESRNITIKNIVSTYQTNELNDFLDQISIFMGDRYSSIKKFYERIKSNLNEGRSFSLNLKDEPQSVVSSSCHLAKELHGIAFLEEYRYFKSPRYLLTAKPSRVPNAINFLSGHWLERYVKAKLISIISSRSDNLQFSYIMNPQIILPNGDDFELDIIFEINDEVYWIEAKTGGYQRHIEKYSKIIPILGVKTSQAFMLLADIDPNTKNRLSSLFGLSVIGIEDAESIFTEIVNDHIAALDQSPQQLVFKCILNSSGCQHIIQAMSEEEAWAAMVNMYPDEIKSDFTIIQT